VLSLLGGSAVALPWVARAQQADRRKIGLLSPGSLAVLKGQIEGFRNGLARGGYELDRNLVIEYRWANGRYDLLPEMAGDLVRRRVEVIAALGTSGPGLAAKAATATIPIVFQTGGDPVEERLVPNMNHPGGNITGVSRLNVATESKRLELLHEMVPSAKFVGYLTNVAEVRSSSETAHIEEAAHSLGLGLHILRASTAGEIETAFATMKRLEVGALLIATGPAQSGIREQIGALTVNHVLPAIAPNRVFTVNGVLMSYDASITDSYRQAGTYVARILDGRDPAELPVLQPERFELTLNLKTAKSFGLTIPPSLLARADEVIE